MTSAENSIKNIAKDYDIPYSVAKCYYDKYNGDLAMYEELEYYIKNRSN